MLLLVHHHVGQYKRSADWSVLGKNPGRNVEMEGSCQPRRAVYDRMIGLI